MSTAHYYETAVLLRTAPQVARIVSVPNAVEPSMVARRVVSSNPNNERYVQSIESAQVALGILQPADFETLSRTDRFDPVAEATLERALIALAGRAPSGDVFELVRELATAPLVIIEESAGAGRALETLLATGGFAGVAYLDGSPVMLTAYGVAWAFLWITGPAIRGARGGVEDAVREHVRERVDAWLRSRLRDRNER